MEDLISPKYLMNLVKDVHEAILNEYMTSEDVEYYINKWHWSIQNWNDYDENFRIYDNGSGGIDLKKTLHNMSGKDLLKIAIDLGVDTPDFIPAIPSFKNELKSDYKTAYDTFTKAYNQIENDPSTAIGLANSALESIIKEILKDERLKSKLSGGETLYKLASIILKEFNLLSSDHPEEIKKIGNSLLTISQKIENLRSENTYFHGKTTDDYLINNSVYTYLIVNAVTTVGLFLNSYYSNLYPKPTQKEEDDDRLPF